jgi:hypothetical protein
MDISLVVAPYDLAHGDQHFEETAALVTAFYLYLT